MFRFLLVLFFLIPLIEIYFLIEVGEVIGAWWTIFAVVATAVIGAGLLRQQGLSTFQRAQTTMAQGQLPALAMLEGMALLFSGAMLMTPGFITDSFGFLLLIPFVRQALIKRMIKNGQFVFQGNVYTNQSGTTDSTIIEGEVVDHENDRYLK